ncbi:DUF4233 domain-containing protein [Microlunatus antarcticus]|uniref:DUF4233 domain-containing protein n=1 Tax=Microlunatus antarcticus TaxID=53388 RepID=A0A7W5JTG2_9ACTN|nr:DUF4233 domain-containing protein [Microlunatus antarcticus]MBB3325963.1 hypothetical protein [Microlunatus antarcticus]
MSTSSPAAAGVPPESPITLSPRNPMRVVLLSVLFFEVVVFALAIPVMILVSDADPLPAALLGSGAAVLALLGAALLRKPVGYPIGWVTQLAGILLGFLTPAMFVVGGMFLALWITSFVLGKRLDARPVA